MSRRINAEEAKVSIGRACKKWPATESVCACSWSIATNDAATSNGNAKGDAACACGPGEIADARRQGRLKDPAKIGAAAHES